MSIYRSVGKLRPRLNVAPLLLTPGFAAVGYVIGGGQMAWWCVEGWLALIVAAAVFCLIQALRGADEDASHAGRRAFDYDGNNASR
jgi:hypothetical protein